jgi:hypothetical protein
MASMMTGYATHSGNGGVTKGLIGGIGIGVRPFISSNGKKSLATQCLFALEMGPLEFDHRAVSPNLFPGD